MGEGVELGGEVAGEGGVLEEEAGLEVALLAGLRAVGGGQEHLGIVDDHAFGVEDGALGGVGVEAAGVVIEVGEALAGPQVGGKVAAEAVDEVRGVAVRVSGVVLALDVGEDADGCAGSSWGSRPWRRRGGARGIARAAGRRPRERGRRRSWR